MTLDKAIEILTQEVNDITLSPDPDMPAALKLGIEALARCQHNYLNPQHANFRRLPSETEE